MIEALEQRKHAALPRLSCGVVLPRMLSRRQRQAASAALQAMRSGSQVHRAICAASTLVLSGQATVKEASDYAVRTYGALPDPENPDAIYPGEPALIAKYLSRAVVEHLDIIAPGWEERA